MLKGASIEFKDRTCSCTVVEVGVDVPCGSDGVQAAPEGGCEMLKDVSLGSRQDLQLRQPVVVAIDTPDVTKAAPRRGWGGVAEC